MGSKENIAIGRKLMEAVNSQDLALLDALVVPDYVNRQLLSPVCDAGTP